MPQDLMEEWWDTLGAKKEFFYKQEKNNNRKEEGIKDYIESEIFSNEILGVSLLYTGINPGRKTLIISNSMDGNFKLIKHILGISLENYDKEIRFNKKTVPDLPDTNDKELKEITKDLGSLIKHNKNIWWLVLNIKEESEIEQLSNEITEFLMENTLKAGFESILWIDPPEPRIIQKILPILQNGGALGVLNKDLISMKWTQDQMYLSDMYDLKSMELVLRELKVNLEKDTIIPTYPYNKQPGFFTVGRKVFNPFVKEEKVKNKIKKTEIEEIFVEVGKDIKDLVDDDEKKIDFANLRD